MGHVAPWKFDPIVPPMRVCTSHIPEGEVDEEARFHSIRTAPCWPMLPP